MTLEQAQEQILKLNEQIKTLSQDNDNYKTQLSEKTEKVSELQEYNQKLFLRITTQTEKKKQADEFNSKLMGDLTKLLSDDELDILKELEEDL